MILLQLGSIKGDSQITGFENWISCTQISWDLTREFKESAKAGTKDVFTGVADVKPITLNKTFDCASPDLMQYACGGGKICDTATIKLLASGGGYGGCQQERLLDVPLGFADHRLLEHQRRRRRAPGGDA